MNCPFPDESVKAVVSYLRRSGQTIACEDGTYLLQLATLEPGATATPVNGAGTPWPAFFIRRDAYGLSACHRVGHAT